MSVRASTAREQSATVTGVGRDAGTVAEPPVCWIEGGVALLDEGRRVERVNVSLGRWLRAMGCDPVGRGFEELLAALGPEWEAAFAPAWEGTGEPFFHAQLRASPAGRTAWYEVEATRHGSGWSVRVQSVLPPLTELAETPWNAHLAGEWEQRRLFMRLLRAEAQLSHLMRSLPGVIFSQRADFAFQFVSPRVGELTGVPAEEWVGQARSFWEVVHEADAEELQQQCRRAVRGREGVATGFRVRNVRTGQIAHVLEHREAVVSAAGLVIGYEGFWLDVTRQKLAERRLSSAAWKETLATLTMGLAHDFSNILAGILSLADTFRAQVDGGHPFAEGLGLIRQNAWQACQLVQRMMNLHRCMTGEMGYHDLNETVTELVDLVQRVLPRRIRVETELAAQALPLYADGMELRQVILNLALNAAEAMPQRGRLRFETRLCEVAALPAHAHGTLPALPCVCLYTRDSGHGIAARHLPHIFDPFFTTKPVNKGSGLGLYNARLFVERHRGAIAVETREGEGTVFSLWLPRADFSEAERVESAVLQRRPSLLLVGEPGMLHDSTAEFLRVQGYYVRQAFAPDRARDALLAEEHPFRAVWILAGPAEPAFLGLVSELRILRPEVKLVLQLVGGEADRVPEEVRRQLDLVITNEMNEETMVKSLRRLCE